MTFDSVANVDTTPQWELALRMAGHANAPKQALESLFQGSIEAFEEVAQQPIGVDLREKIWVRLYEPAIEVVKRTLLREFCNNILSGYTDTQMNEMLQEHRMTNFIRNPFYSEGIQAAYQLKQESIIDAVKTDAQTINNELIPQIVTIIQEAGITLPEPAPKSL